MESVVGNSLSESIEFVVENYGLRSRRSWSLLTMESFIGNYGNAHTDVNVIGIHGTWLSEST